MENINGATMISRGAVTHYKRANLLSTGNELLARSPTLIAILSLRARPVLPLTSTSSRWSACC